MQIQTGPWVGIGLNSSNREKNKEQQRAEEFPIFLIVLILGGALWRSQQAKFKV